MGFLFGKTAMGTYVVVAFWVACYYFFSNVFPAWHFDTSLTGDDLKAQTALAQPLMALLIGFLLIVANMISVYLFIKVAGNRPWEWFEDGTYGPGDEG